VILLSIRDVLHKLAADLRLDGAEAVRDGSQLLVIWLFAWLAVVAIRLAARRIEHAVDGGIVSGIASRREKRGKTISQLLRVVGRAAVVIVALLLTFNLFIDIGPLLASAGIIGLAFSFGAQSLVKDVLSGFFMLVEDQFALGDVIEAAGRSGVVEKMSLRVVVLRDTDGTIHIIPNGEIKTVSNKTRGWGRAVVDVGVPYGEDVDRALAVLGDETKRIAADPAWAAVLDGPIEVTGVEALGEHAYTIRILARTQPGQQWAVARELRLRIRKRLDLERIQHAVPSRRVTVSVAGAGPGAGAGAGPGVGGAADGQDAVTTAAAGGA
jgi:moderate conductance mechanosensitive channel